MQYTYFPWLLFFGPIKITLSNYLKPMVCNFFSSFFFFNIFTYRERFFSSCRTKQSKNVCLALFKLVSLLYDFPINILVYLLVFPFEEAYINPLLCEICSQLVLLRSNVYSSFHVLLCFARTSSLVKERMFAVSASSILF